MMKFMCATLFSTFVLASAVPAADKSEDKAADQSAKFESAVKVLQNERRKLAYDEHVMRTKIIKDTPEIEKLHKQIMELHRALALGIDKDPRMKEILKKVDELDKKLAAAAAELGKFLESSKN